jgi:2,3-bisphosphoglycerate-dependent phosphoglycerate mutase
MPKNNKTIIIFIRHGETEWNLSSRLMGLLDSPLTRKGVAQGKAIAERLSKEQFTALYSSDLGRAFHTAEFISGATKKKIVLEKDLREMNMGIYQGLTREDMLIKYPEEMRQFEELGPAYTLPDAENIMKKDERVKSVMNKLARRHIGEKIVIVSHGGILTSLFEYVLDMPPGSSWRFQRFNGSYNSFSFSDGFWSLVTWGDISHLEGIGTMDDPSLKLGLLNDSCADFCSNQLIIS